MAIVETEQDGGVMVIRLNRPERLNALSHELRVEMAKAFRAFRDSRKTEVAILTGTGRGFCAGEDMKDAVEKGTVGLVGDVGEDPYTNGTLDKVVIAAINGFAMGGGFMLAERADLRIAVREAVFEMSEAKRWLLGGYNHGHIGNLPHTVATEMAFAFRFPAQRLYELGWLNRVVEPEQLLPEAKAMAAHLMTLPPASRVNTLLMMKAMRPRVPEGLEELAARLKEHGAKSDLTESRQAFAEKRAPQFKGWNDPGDRAKTPRS